jgi:ParB/RepB/Spo0J family partition protein
MAASKTGTAIFAADHEQGRSNVYRLDPRDIVCDWRKNLSRGGVEPKVDDKLIALAESMAPKTGPGDAADGSSGQLNPVLVRMLPDRRAELVGGFRRYRAALWLIESGRCPDFQLMCTKCTLSDAEAALTNMDENIQRSDPEPIQLAHAIRALHEGYGMPLSVIAKRLRMSTNYTNYLLQLTGLPTEIQDAVTSGQASAAAAAELTDLPGPIAIEIFNEVKEAAGKKVRAKDLVKAANGKAKGDGELPTPTGTPTAASSVVSGKGPKIQATDIKEAKRKRADAAINAGGDVAVEARPTIRKSKEVLAFFDDCITAMDCPPEGKKVAKAIAKFIRGESTAEQLNKFWDKQFPMPDDGK